MKISHIESQIVVLPEADPLAGSPEIHSHLVAAVPNGLTVEYMGWMLRLFDGVAILDNGELVLSDRPGLGLAFNQETIKRFGVAS